jgi:hypothetical protein
VTPRRASLVAAAGYVAAVALGLVYGHGAAVALAAALGLATALAVATALELRPPQTERPPQRARDTEMPLRLRQIVDVVHESQRSELAVDRSLRPLLVPIVVARLGRHGVDMTLAPRRAQELLGDVLWQIVRPDRPPATYRLGRGLAEDDLRTAIRRLEQL